MHHGSANMHEARAHNIIYIFLLRAGRLSKLDRGILGRIFAHHDYRARSILSGRGAYTLGRAAGRGRRLPMCRRCNGMQLAGYVQAF